jgi:heme/copper-type cytochrome/quinol oxidase subunit 2
MSGISLGGAIFWIAVASCAIAQVAILRSTLAKRAASSAATEHADPSMTVARSSYRVELLWAVIPAVGLALVLWFTWLQIGAHERGHAVDAHGHVIASLEVAP